MVRVPVQRVAQEVLEGIALKEVRQYIDQRRLFAAVLRAMGYRVREIAAICGVVHYQTSLDLKALVPQELAYAESLASHIQGAWLEECERTLLGLYGLEPQGEVAQLRPGVCVPWELAVATVRFICRPRTEKNIVWWMAYLGRCFGYSDQQVANNTGKTRGHIGAIRHLMEHRRRGQWRYLPLYGPKLRRICAKVAVAWQLEEERWREETSQQKLKALKALIEDASEPSQVVVPASA